MHSRVWRQFFETGHGTTIVGRPADLALRRAQLTRSGQAMTPVRRARPSRSCMLEPMRTRFLAFAVIPGWTAVLVPLPLIVVLAVGSYTGSALPWLQDQIGLATFVVLALAILGFAGAYAATEPAPPVQVSSGRPSIIRRLGGPRLVALSLLCGCAYLLSALARFIEDPEDSYRAGQAFRWGIPLSLCFWTLASIEIANETESSGSGEPADPSRQWSWFVDIRRKAWARPVGYGTLFVGTISFAVLGSVPGQLWTRAADDGVAAWRGHGSTPTAIYSFGFVPWATVLLVTSALFLAHSFRARPAGLPGAVLRRAWYSLWASSALAVLMVFFGFSAGGWLAEPLIDLALALYGVCFVLVLVDAAATTRHRRVKSSLRRRVVGAAGAIGFAFGVALIAGLDFFRTGLLAATIAAGIPLFPVVLRALFGIQRVHGDDIETSDPVVYDGPQLVAPVPTDLSEREALLQVLVGGPSSAAGGLLDPEVLSTWHRSLSQLKSVPLPEVSNIPRSHPLVFVLFTCDDGLTNTKTYLEHMPDPMIECLERLFPGNLDDQLHALIDLMRRTASALFGSQRDAGGRRPPSAMEMTEAECAARSPVLADQTEPERSRRLRQLRTNYLFGRDKVPWGNVNLPVELVPTGKYRKAEGETRSKRLAYACPVIMKWWLDNLQTLISIDTMASGRLTAQVTSSVGVSPQNVVPVSGDPSGAAPAPSGSAAVPPSRNWE